MMRKSTPIHPWETYLCTHKHTYVSTCGTQVLIGGQTLIRNVFGVGSPSVGRTLLRSPVPF